MTVILTEAPVAPVESGRGVMTLAMLAMGACWGLSQPLTKTAVSTGHGAFGLVFWQMMIAALLLSAINIVRGKGLPLRPTALKLYAFIALAGTVIPNSISYTAAFHLPSGVMSIVVSTVPMFALPIALMLGTDRFSWRRLLGLALGLAGVALIALPEASLPDVAVVAFVPLALIAPFCYAVEANVVGRWGVDGLDPVQVLQGASIIGVLVMLPIALGTGQFIDPRLPWGLPEGALILSSLINALVYTAYVWIVGQAGAVFAAQVSYFVTGFGVVWAMVLLGERYSLFVWAALLLMLLGLSLVQPRRPRVEIA